MQRRTALVALAVLASATTVLTGCSNNAPGASSDSKSVTMIASNDNRTVYEAVIKRFEAKNPGYTVKVNWLAGNGFEATENTQLSAGQAPDILSVQPGIGGNLTSVGSFGKKGYLADLSGQEWTSKLSDSLKSQTDYQGKTYMLPTALQPLGAFYNTASMKDAGLSAPKTWTDVLAFCKAAKAKGKVAYSLGLSDQWVGQLVPYALAATLVYRDDPNWNSQLVAGTKTFPKSAWLTVEQKYQQMNTAGCFSANPNGISFDNTLPPVAQGKALAIVQVGGVFASLAKLDTKATYDLQPLPATDEASQTAMAASLTIGVGVNAKAKNKDLAMRFVNFFASPEGQNAFAGTTGASIPALADTGFKTPALLQTFSQYNEAGKIGPFPDTGWPNPEIQNAHLVGIQNLFLGKTSPQQLTDSMQAAVK